MSRAAMTLFVPLTALAARLKPSEGQAQDPHDAGCNFMRRAKYGFKAANATDSATCLCS